MAQAFGNQTSPTLRSLLAGKPSTIVSPDTTVLDAGILMAERRKAALVVDDNELVGIFGFKDLMTRVIAKELSLDQTDIASVMTPSPESVLPEMTVLEALQMMHENRFLTLPVCEEDGTVVGLVDVMDVIYGCGGVEGWRSIFSSSLDLDDASDTASVHSGRGSSVGSTTRSIKSPKNTVPGAGDVRPVSKLRPKKPLLSHTEDSILDVTKMLASKRGDAALVVDDAGCLAGILTDTDITRRVVARHVDPFSTNVSHVMTRNPTCVSMTDSAMDAMSTMVENHFRHLPVVDEKGAVVGLLDIAKCLNDAISKLEKAQTRGSNSADEALKQVVGQHGAQGAQAAALQALLGPLLAQAFGNQASPTLRSLLAGKPSTIVNPVTTVLDAGMLMAEHRKAALVVENNELVGLFSFKDLMTRVIAKELPLEETAILSVMTPDPESVSPDMTVLGALQMMHDNKFLTLPVCETDGTVLGVVDVMDVIYGCGGADGWRSIFSSSLDLDDLSESGSRHSGIGSTPGSQVLNAIRKKPISAVRGMATKSIPEVRVQPRITVAVDASFLSPIPGNIPRTLEFKEGSAEYEDGNMSRMESRADYSLSGMSPEGHAMVFKVVDPSGNTHRIRADARLASLREAFLEKVDNKSAQFSFVDDEGDTILISSDADLTEAVNLARASGSKVVKLTASEAVGTSDGAVDPMILAVAGVAVAVVGLIAMVVFRPRK
jgi:CBS domain-containing protein